MWYAKILLLQRTTITRVPGSQHTWPDSSSILPHTLRGNRQCLKHLSPCHPHERSRLSSELLLTLAWPHCGYLTSEPVNKRHLSCSYSIKNKYVQEPATLNKMIITHIHPKSNIDTIQTSNSTSGWNRCRRTPSRASVSHIPSSTMQNT